MLLLCGTLMLQKDKKLVEDTKLKVCITLTCADIIFGLSTKTENSCPVSLLNFPVEAQSSGTNNIVNKAASGES